MTEEQVSLASQSLLVLEYHRRPTLPTISQPVLEWGQFGVETVDVQANLYSPSGSGDAPSDESFVGHVVRL